tara:strand:+ start:47279 stop:48448 length:1170 start_codon:yes stop_codon:yes gene_type:complete
MTDLHREIKNQLAKVMINQNLYRHPDVYPKAEWGQFKVTYDVDDAYLYSNCLTIMPPRHFNKARLEYGENPADFPTWKAHIKYRDKVIERTKTTYKALGAILKKFKGKIILAGGSLSEQFSPKDVDLYFINCCKKERLEIIKQCEDIIRQEHPDLDEFELEEVGILHNIKIQDRGLHPSELGPGRSYKIIYQFINKEYFSISDVLRGFDFFASQIAYDGETIWATEQGAWAYMNNILIIDISRVSQNFGHRLMRYSNKLFQIVIPGIMSGSDFTVYGRVSAKEICQSFLCVNIRYERRKNINECIVLPDNVIGHDGKLDDYAVGNQKLTPEQFYTGDPNRRQICYPLLTPEVETILRLGMKYDSDSVLYGLTKDIFRLIIVFVGVLDVH